MVDQFHGLAKAHYYLSLHFSGVLPCLFFKHQHPPPPSMQLRTENGSE
jgi:hypothetical protein